MKKVLMLSGLTLMLAACGSNDDTTTPIQSGNDTADNTVTNDAGTDNSMTNDGADNGMTDNSANDGMTNDTTDNAASDDTAAGDESSTFAYGVRDFDLDIELSDGSDYQYDYEDEGGNIEAEIELEDGNGDEMETSGASAQEEMESMLNALQIVPSTDPDDAMMQIVDYLELNEADITEFDLEIEFQDGERLSIDR